jgi:hypothetical protein
MTDQSTSVLLPVDIQPVFTPSGALPVYQGAATIGHRADLVIDGRGTRRGCGAICRQGFCPSAPTPRISPVRRG